MTARLDPRPGEWIDRRRSLSFRFEGKEYSGFAGDTLSSALWANGVRVLGRSFKYHRPRGLLSAANHDVNAVFADAGTTNLRGDATALREGMDFRAVNTRGGVEKDSARFVEWLSPFMPVGFYYKAFHTPRRLFPRWERLMRAMAGLGAVDTAWKRLRTPKSYSFCDVLVVGAGPAGLSAAVAAAESGARVILVDENPHPGGTLGYQGAPAPGVLESLLRRARELGVDLRTGTEAAGYYADHWVALVDAERMSKARAKAVVFANGCFEQPCVFRNNDLPGVMLASGAQRLVYRFRVKPFDRAVVLTANADGYQAALDLREAGVDVAAVVDLRPEPEASEAGRRVAEARIPVHARSAVAEAVPRRGKRGVRGARVCPLDGEGRPLPEAGREIPCDGIAVSVGWAPADSLFCQAGGKMAYNDLLQQFVPARAPEGVFAAGRLNGIFDLNDRLADGARAGRAAAAHAGFAAGPDVRAPERAGPARSHPYPVFPHPRGKEFVDLDEDLQVKDLENAIQEGYDNVELLKRYSTFGMGPSQGKLANTNTLRILARRLGRPVAETGNPTARPFFHPVPLSHLAGRGFNPHRETPMHARHEAAGARFLHAGAWLRPAYYASPGATRDEAIAREVEAVRGRAGIVDVSTLGKIEIAGPDAAAFIERLYTARFAKMKPGTTRYAVMCDESGVVIDDGVAARIDEERFYVTSTTTGADGVFREMQRWALLWGMRVALTNVTGTYAAMNLAGPEARKILAPLTDARLDEAAFPYLGFREGTVAGAPARLLRVGFVGELGYEIHVPSHHGRHVWDAILKEGAGAGLCPFGVEAQRVLRLEKGHVIIGQDTDGLTTPFEAALDWAVKMDKPFFVGQRSLAILSKRPPKRRLVGFMLPEGYAGPAPKECHLVIEAGKITGRVTSVTESPTLQRWLGLAYVPPERAEPGKRFTVRVDGGREVEAAVASFPFYDPENRRQADGAPKAAEKKEKVREVS
jgi:sarcosine oxidase subunit alpha